MCGRYCTNTETAAEVARLIPNIDKGIRLYNDSGDITPSQTATVLHSKNGLWSASDMAWGFPGRGEKGLLINARAETLLERPMFASSALHRRCIIPAQAFYEWNQNNEKAIFTKAETPVLYMAGIYNTFKNQTRFVIITTAANESVRSTHHRMPLILESTDIQDWVFNNSSTSFLLSKKPAPLLANYNYYQQNIFDIF